MLESTMARSVVGRWITGTPRMYSAATKPAKSPVTPPPTATTADLRDRPFSSIQLSAPSARAYDLCSSPCGMRQVSYFSKPAKTPSMYSPWRE